MKVMPTALLDGLELQLHLLPQLEVERAERLVEQQHLGLVHQRAGERHALSLAARELRRPAGIVAVETHHPERVRDARLALRAGHLADHQPVGHVVGDGHVGEQGVVLEDGVDVALERRTARDVFAGQQDPAAGGQLEAGDHAQGRRLARAGRAEQREELAGADVQVHARDRHDLAEGLAHPVEAHGHVRRHRRSGGDVGGTSLHAVPQCAGPWHRRCDLLSRHGRGASMAPHCATSRGPVSSRSVLPSRRYTCQARHRAGQGDLPA